MRALVTGASGMLGREVVAALTAVGHEVISTSRTRPGWPRLEITDPDDCVSVVRAARPEVVVHLAYDQGSWAVTAEGAANIARAASGAGAHLVLMSSDLVFGSSAELRLESESPCPTIAYGAAKAAAEVAAAAFVPGATIARCSVLIGRGDGHQERLVRAAATGEWSGAFYSDQFRCPTYAPDVAAALVACAEQRVPGVVHLVGDDHLSRIEIAREVARLIGVDADRLRAAPAPQGPGMPPSDLRLAPTERVAVPVRGISGLSSLG